MPTDGVKISENSSEASNEGFRAPSKDLSQAAILRAHSTRAYTHVCWPNAVRQKSKIRHRLIGFEFGDVMLGCAMRC